jgi:hypothetical protein
MNLLNLIVLILGFFPVVLFVFSLRLWAEEHKKRGHKIPEHHDVASVRRNPKNTGTLEPA